VKRLSVAVTGLLCLALFSFFASGIGRGADDIDERLLILGVALFVAVIVVIRVGAHFRPGWNAYDDLSPVERRRGWIAMTIAVVAGFVFRIARTLLGS
jgi:hypothetical protein